MSHTSHTLLGVASWSDRISAPGSCVSEGNTFIWKRINEAADYNGKIT